MACQAGARRILNEAFATWPSITTNPGCFNPNSCFDGTGPGTGRPCSPSAHGKGEAIDIGIVPAHRGDNGMGMVIFNFLHSNRGRLGIVQLIYNSRIWSATNSPGQIRPYTANRHLDHIHVQFSPDAARNGNLTLDLSPPEEPDMNARQNDILEWIANWLKDGGYDARSDGKPSRVETIQREVNAIFKRPAVTVNAKQVADEIVDELGPEVAKAVLDAMAVRLANG